MWKWILVGILIVLTIWFLRKGLQSAISSELKLLSSVNKSPSIENQYQLLFFFADLENNQETWGCFQDQGRYFLVRSADLSIHSIDEIAPGFRGRPLGIVYYQNNFIIFSSDGYVYNPYSGSHPWRRDYFYLPYQDPISIDGTLAQNGKGIFNAGKNGDILFTFYYSGYSISEQICVQPFNNLPEMKCPNVQTSYPLPPVQVRSYSRIGGVLTAVGVNGFLYILEGNSWNQSIQWTTIFGQLAFPVHQKSNSRGLTLLGADFDDGVPIFVIQDSGKVLLIDRAGRKKSLQVPADQIVDFTRSGPNDPDTFLLLKGNVLFNPFTNKTRKVSEFETLFSSPINEACSSISRIRKWQPDLLASSSTRKDFLIFFYPSGKWFEIHYDSVNDKIEELGESYVTSGLWTNFEHLQNQSLSGAKLSAYGWSAFLTSGQVISFHTTPVVWSTLLYCLPDSDDNLPDTCVGKSDTSVPELTRANEIFSTKTIGNYKVYEDLGIDVSTLIADLIVRKVSFARATQIATQNNWEFFVYDANECNGHYFHSLLKKQTFPLIEMSVFARSDMEANFLNRFCLQNSDGKYLYWDFTNPNSQFLGTKDTCLPNLTQDYTGSNLTATGVAEAQKGMGAIWSFDSGAIKNINAAVGGFLQTDLTLGGRSDFRIVNSLLQSQNGCLDKDLKLLSTGCANWTLEKLNCPSSTGYILNYCS